jgi:alpha-1,2-mannosyltransferase
MMRSAAAGSGPPATLRVHREPRAPAAGGEGIVWFFWLLLIAAACAFVAMRPQRSVTMHYFNGANHWLAGARLYNRVGSGFLYLPSTAILFVPFAVLPSLIGNFLWRIVSIGCYAWGVRRLSALGEQTTGFPLFALATCIAIPLAWAGAHNGQATLPMAGLMMAAVSFLPRERWWSAAVCLVLAVTVKPLAIVLVLLAAVLYPPLIGRLLIALGVVLALPFLTQDAEYVSSQYAGFVTMTKLATDRSNVDYFAQVFGVLRIAGLHVPQAAQTAVRAVFAGLTLAACLYFRPKLQAQRFGLYLFALAGCYLMLFNPRTENNTYALLAPAIGVFCAEAVRSRRAARAWLLLGISLAMLGSYEIGRLITPPAQSVWLAPLAAIAFTALVLRELAREASGGPRLPARRQPEIPRTVDAARVAA